MNRIWREDGAALVEFALTSVVLFMTLFGLMAVCTALYSSVFVAEAAREASRYAIVRGSACTGFADCSITSAQLNTYVQNLHYPGINSANLSASASWAGGKAPGQIVVVTVTYNLPLAIPFWPKSGSTIHMGSTSQMAISQ
ncbi:MAG TPA: TadE/TadG family type IV pilus assembly protein [Terracidiphilus sp.]|jgi:Flp pilus assembly protein TadG|nr:TadE/TadG family type IV pilus assembly protein [Terracidiphilus sp.]